MSLLSFNHLLHLSFAWHTKRKTGEVLRVLDRGSAINDTFHVRTFFYSYLVALTPPIAFVVHNRPRVH
jgi:ABC-type transport system involved in Fe-S cluster assembly fused permease/ATPase subunit